MKNLFTSLAAIILTASVFAQAPQKMSYQAVIRNSSNDLVINTQITMKISILQGTATGTVVYVETKTPKTNSNGLINIEFGGGAGFNNINWSNGPFFLKTEIDPNGSTNYSIIGTSRLISVPYALHAETAETVTETDPVYTGSQAANITANDIAKLNNLSGTNTGDQDLSAYATKTALQAQDEMVDALLARIEVLELVNEGFTDSRDGNHYGVVKIGNQLWMRENLRYLPSVSDQATTSTTVPYYYVYGYNGNDVNAAKATAEYFTYGALYNWPAAMNGAVCSSANPSGVKGVCPTGWHLPSDAEWTQLTDYLGGVGIAGGKLKETGTLHWLDPNRGATNETGFTGLPGGYRYIDGTFYWVGITGMWWSATLSYSNYCWYRRLDNGSWDVQINNYYKQGALSVRCVKD